ncbi:hypothetical protein PoB_006224500 [Plakobranchus ocellatus]|uniref:Uncharacterized protein n=1 Tax=Plakobranchus ocellatus TaxID=259542 RepID=A0AAV4CV41_9GAST|nr:hypothetical protein PoB_006224500 [Plakobranchus ocellatus]
MESSQLSYFDLHISCFEQMLPLFFSRDHHNYARYLTTYIILLLNLNDSHPGAEESIRVKGFGVCKSPASGARNAVDLTIEQTINRRAKCKGGIVGFRQNLAAYHKLCITRHNRANLALALFEERG